MKAKIGVIAACFLLLGAPAMAQGTNDGRDGWRVSLTPYLWAAGFSGDLAVRDRSVGQRLSARTEGGASELLESLRFAFMGAAEVRYARFGLVLDVMTLSLERKLDTPRDLAFNGGKADLSGTQFSALAVFRAVEMTDFSLDLGLGLRAWWMDTGLRLNPGLLAGRSSSSDVQFTDPILAIRGEYRLSNRWSLRAHGDIGGFGAGSRFSWQAIGTVAWRASRSITLEAGYRHIGLDFQRRGTTLDIGLGGPILGLTWTF